MTPTGDVCIIKESAMVETGYKNLGRAVFLDEFLTLSADAAVRRNLGRVRSV